MKKFLATQLIWFEAQDIHEAEKMLAKGVMKNATIYKSLFETVEVSVFFYYESPNGTTPRYNKETNRYESKLEIESNHLGSPIDVINEAKEKCGINSKRQFKRIAKRNITSFNDMNIMYMKYNGVQYYFSEVFDKKVSA